MIIQWFAEMIYKVLTGMLGWINLPHLPDDVQNGVAAIFDFVYDGYGLFNFFVPRNLITVGLPILLVITAFKYGYFFVMWIIKKIPVAGIS